jgi:predicted metal-dependent hydrolase
MLGEVQISYELTRKKVKNINLRIYPDGAIKVSASTRVPIETVDRFILSRSEFILGALGKFEARRQSAPKKRDFQNGDSVRIFDEILTLKVFIGNKNFVEENGDELWLFVKDDNRELKEKTLEAYLKSVLSEKISSVLPEVYSRFSEYNVDLPEIKIRKMMSRCGSCNTTKKIVTLSLLLAEYPTDCLRFVISHELCHLVHPNHSKDFYALLAAVMPEWKEHKQKLNHK